MGLWDRFRRRDETPILESAPTKTPERAGFEYAVPVGGLTEHNQSAGTMSSDRRSLLTELYEVFLACPWSWACVNAISRTITAGGLVMDWAADDGEGGQDQPEKPENVLALERLLDYVNPREDIRQLLRSTIADLLVFGDAYIEVLWIGQQPVALYTLDAPTMMPITDEHGDIKQFVQVTEFGQRAEFEPREVIHISLDAPRSGVFGVSPTQAALLPITAWLFTEATLKETYRKGNPPLLHVDMPAGTPTTEMNKWVAQHQQRNIGPRNIGNPIVTKGGAPVNELNTGKIADMLATLDQKRDEIIATYGVPPAEVSIIESGNLGGGTGESQRKTYLVNTCQPIAEILLEKLNFALAKQGFGIDGWRMKFAEVDMRDSLTIEQIRDMRLRNGSWVLDRYRTEIGEPPVPGGDQAVLVDRQNIVLWRDMDAKSKAGIAKDLKGSALEPGEPGSEETPVALHKPAPKPVPAGLRGFADHEEPSDDAEPGAKPGKEQSKPIETTAVGGRRVLTESWHRRYQDRRRQALAQLTEVSRE